MRFRFHFFDTLASTNDTAREKFYRHGDVIVADAQTAGRGQRGNVWSSSPGLNLMFSVVLEPVFLPAAEQFRLLQCVALSLSDMFGSYGLDARIKWTNDIYVGDRKIVGVLMEQSLRGGYMDRCVVGIGINVNQQEFVSDAPNPVSLWQITRHEYDLGSLLNDVCMAIIEAVECLSDAQLRSEIAREYRGRLWRREGLHPFRYPDGRLFMAEIVEVLPTGHLVLRHDDRQLSTHAFKEVIQIL